LAAFEHLKSCWEGHHISHACTLRKISMTCEGIRTCDENETTLRKLEPMELKYSEFLLLDLLWSNEI